MERTKVNKRYPSIIFCSDFHLREDTPVCWIGDFQEEQWTGVDFISRLQREYNCIVIHAGDLFNHWKPSPWLLRMTIKHLPDQFYTVYGQHDLPQHNLELTDKCGIDVLKAAGKLKVLNGCHYGQEPKGDLFDSVWWETSDTFFPMNYKRKILVWHHLTYVIPPFPGAKDGQAKGILRKYPQYDLIVTGDNHQSFYDTYEGRLLVNPGSLTRQKADQINYRPRVFLWYEETNSVKAVYIPIKEGVISREHLDREVQRDKRIEAFISRLDKDWDAGVSFEQNLEEFKRTNDVRESIMNIIYKSIEL